MKRINQNLAKSSRAKRASQRGGITNEALPENEWHYRSLFEHSPDAVLLTIPDGTIEAANPAACALFGMSEEEICQRGRAGLVDAADPRTSALTEERRRNGRIANREATLIRKDGTQFPAEISSVIIPGEPPRAFVIIRDITQHKQAEEALQKTQQELARVNDELEHKIQERTAQLEESLGDLEQFAYTITHDMRAPLRAMRGFGEMLLQQCRDCEYAQRRDFLRRISDASVRMDQLITDVLKFNRVLRSSFDLAPVDPVPLLRGMVESYPQFQRPHADIAIAQNIPWVFGNKAGMTLCFSSLLDNAVKFVEPGKLPQIRIRPEQRGDFVRLWFEDNGLGIDPEYHETIFQMFQRLDQTYAGTGIGLALVRKVVERMGGKVGLESEPGQGSRFWLEFKRIDQPVTGYAAESSTLR